MKNAALEAVKESQKVQYNKYINFNNHRGHSLIRCKEIFKIMFAEDNLCSMCERFCYTQHNYGTASAQQDIQEVLGMRFLVTQPSQGYLGYINKYIYILKRIRNVYIYIYIWQSKQQAER